MFAVGVRQESVSFTPTSRPFCMPSSIHPSTAIADSVADVHGDDGVVVRRVQTLAEYQECVRVQEEIWGDGFRERVPVAILLVAQKLGGVCAAAFDRSDRMLGFVFGLTGIRDGVLVHWSDLLAVRAEARGAHIGERLKRFQRELCLATGVHTMHWTFDPLVARNAHLNLVRLGARASEYVVNMYGSNTGSPLHGGVETDRWIAAWDLADASTAPRPGAPRAEGVFVVRASAVQPMRPEWNDAPDASVVRVAVPEDHERLSLADRLGWREVTRRAFTHYLARGGTVLGFHRASGDLPPFYEIARDPAIRDTASSL